MKRYEIFLAVFLLGSCNYYHKRAIADDPPPADTPVSFADVKPILDKNCTTCHGGGKTSGGFNIDTYANVMKAVVAGNSSSSDLFIQVDSGKMPLGSGPMDPKEVAIIKAFIDQGANETPIIPPPPVTPPPVTPPPVTTGAFADIKTRILDVNCATCHGGGKSSGGFSIDTYASVMAQVVAGDSNKSELYFQIYSGQMPLGKPKLEDKLIEDVRVWIDGGAKE